jgi:hypothetical protein
VRRARSRRVFFPTRIANDASYKGRSVRCSLQFKVPPPTPEIFDYDLSEFTEVPYLLANGVRLARLAYEYLGDVPSIGAATLHVFFEPGDHLGSTRVVLDKKTSELWGLFRHWAASRAGESITSTLRVAEPELADPEQAIPLWAQHRARWRRAWWWPSWRARTLGARAPPLAAQVGAAKRSARRGWRELPGLYAARAARASEPSALPPPCARSAGCADAEPRYWYRALRSPREHA